MAQQLAHHTVSGCNIRVGDLMGSGTISGAAPDALGSLLELTRNGRAPIALDGGEERTFLEDGDEVILDDSSPRALAIDARLPESAAEVSAALLAQWPRLAGRVEFVQGPIAGVQFARGDVAVSAHACGTLTDEILAIAAAAQARVAVLPCCHDGDANDAAGLQGWLDPALAIDTVRAVELRNRGYQVHTQTIPLSITPKNRLLLGRPLLELYEATRYQAHLPQGTVVLRHGEPAPALDALLEPAAPWWAFITAWNPGSRRLSRPENERRQQALLRELAGRFRLFHGKGVGDEGAWPAELSVLALGIPHGEALARGRAFGQRAVLLGTRGEPARMTSCGLEQGRSGEPRDG